MKTQSRLFSKVIYFSRWCRKGYAVFAALGRQVLISVVSLGICRSALLKTARKGTIITSESCRAVEWVPVAAFEAYLKRKGMLRMTEEVCPDGNKKRMDKQGYARRVYPCFGLYRD